MSGEEGLWASIQAEWIKVCPCRLIRKNICMFLIVVRCVKLQGTTKRWFPVGELSGVAVS